MTEVAARKPLRLSYAGFAGLLVLVTASMVAIGYAPTQRVGGHPAVSAMLWACAVSALASATAALPLALGPALAKVVQPISLVLSSIYLRLLLALGFGFAVWLAGDLPKRPFFLWLGISYGSLLIVDAIYSLASLKRLTSEE